MTKLNANQRVNLNTLEKLLEMEYTNGYINKRANYITLIITKYQGEIVHYSVQKHGWNRPNPRMFVEHYIGENTGSDDEETFYIHFDSELTLTVIDVLNTIKNKYPSILD